jgi:hypothetical protein
MLDKDKVIEKMEERGFTVYAHMGNSSIQFVSAHMYTTSKKRTKRESPVINIIVDLEKDEFSCFYNIDNSINTLQAPPCSPVLDNKHFDGIVSKFEAHAGWMEKLRVE